MLNKARIQLQESHDELEKRVKERTSELEKVNRQLEELSITDGLTGLYNHRYLMQTLPTEYERAVRYNHSLAFLMLDIDHFKQVNDRFGHPCGDLVLQNISAVLKKNMRKADLIARYGGEEIAMLLFEADSSMALHVAEKLRLMIERHNFLCDGNSLNVTVSIGLAVYPENNIQSWSELLDSADQAVYRAKELGRNKVITYTPDEKKT